MRLRRSVLLVLCLLFESLFLHGCARVQKPPLTITPIPPLVTPMRVYHTVERGQTLYRIAKIYHIDVQDLMRVNQISDPRGLETGQRLLIPGAPPSFFPIPRAPLGVNVEKIRKLVGPKKNTSVWLTITLHHSATLQGNARLFDRDHFRRHMGGLFYHFVIGNGSRSTDGQVEVGWRWRRQVKANRPNDIQICLVGNFSIQEVSEAQYASLLTLMKILREQYSIPLNSIRRHDDIKGKRTECPGKKFPLHRLLADLAKG